LFSFFYFSATAKRKLQELKVSSTLFLLLEHFSYIGLIGFRNQGSVRKITFLLDGLLGQDVAFVSMLPFDLTGTCKGKPFLGAGF
jgi:hypothetical protein